MQVNQLGHPVESAALFGLITDDTLVTNREAVNAINLLCIHLNVTIVRNCDTKTGTTDLELIVNE